MALYTEGVIYASLHDFKTNISKYTRMLERGEYRAVMVQRYRTTIGVYITNESQKRWAARQAKKSEI